MERTNYGGLDWLKFAAAVMVVANHTGPLGSYGPYADFLVSNVLTRIAVPIFFLSAGFFFFRKLTGDREADRKALYGYSKKIGKLYAIAIALYLPLDVYTGYFTTDFTALSFLRDLVFDGTFYHLWYLPALLLGLPIAYGLSKRLPPKAMLAAAGFLYAIGLLGDSYYGLIAGDEGLARLYDGMFAAFDYTRNGLFYAPVYLALGAWMAKRRPTEGNPRAHAALFAVSLGLMLAEGMLLREADFPRHDSMYAFAVPAAYFLFRWALSWKGRSGKAFREWRVWIYILHPIGIVLVRGASEAANLESLFIANSLLHFLAVCAVSVAMAAAAVRIIPAVKLKGPFAKDALHGAAKD